MALFERRRRPRVAVVGTDLKFIRPLVQRLGDEFDFTVDEWPKFRAHDAKVTAKAIGWARVVICEWAGPNAVLASQGKRRGQRLIVRLHRMELGHPYWRDIDIDAVDVVVTVGPHYRERTLETTGWPPDKVVVIPNFVDSEKLALPKAPGAVMNIGMLGYASRRKRLDLALDVFERARAAEPELELLLKGSDPWNRKWVSDRPDEAAYFAGVRDEIRARPGLEESIVFDPAGPDVAEWFRRVGFILSVSDDESFHLSPAEGMASAAVPVIRDWPGADQIYDSEWVVGGIPAMADRIVSLASDEILWREAGERARREVVARFDIDLVARRWASLILDGE